MAKRKTARKPRARVAESPAAPPRPTRSPDAVVLWSIVGLGVILRTIAWIGRVDLWVDEVAIARNVLDRTMWDLLVVPLDYGQTAPKGFLLLEWLVLRVAGNADAALRFVPWAASVASLFAFKRLGARILGRAGLIAALAIFAIGQPFIFYSAEAKQYTLDLAISLWLIAETIDVRERGWPRRAVIRLAVFGFVAVWFSQFAVITLTALGVTAVVLEKRHGARATVSSLWPLALLWGVAAAAATFVSIRSMFPATLGYMHWFHAVNMPPWPLREPKDWFWFWTRLRGMMGIDHDWDVGDRRWTVVYPALALVGLVVLAVRRKATAALLIAPLIMTLVLVMAHQYPLIVRLALVPLAILVIGIGGVADAISTYAVRARPRVAFALGLLVVVPAVVRLVSTPPPYQLETPGPALRAVKAQWREGDKLFAPFEGAMVTDYYAPRLGLREGRDYVHAQCDRAAGQPPGQLEVLDTFRGAPRVWVLTGAVSGTRPPLELVYAQYIGVQWDSVIPRMPGSFGSQPSKPYENYRAFLFDFSDSARLAAHPPGSLRVGRPRPSGDAAIRRFDPKWCYGVFMPHMAESKGEIPEAWRNER